jgi:hypothetical protein
MQAMRPTVGEGAWRVGSARDQGATLEEGWFCSGGYPVGIRWVSGGYFVEFLSCRGATVAAGRCPGRDVSG